MRFLRMFCSTARLVLIVMALWAGAAAPACALAEDDEKQAKGIAAYAMGIIYDLYGHPDLAIEEFKRSAEYEDNDAVRLRLGADYARLGKLPEAISDLNKALDFDPQNIQARYLLALIHSSQNHYDLAAKEYEAILTSFSEAQPENIEIYGYLAQLYYSQKQYDKAAQQFEAVLSIDPKNSEVMFLLGLLYLEMEEGDKAVTLFERTLQYEPDNHRCLNSLGYLYAERGERLQEAKVLIEKALTLKPDDGAYLDSLGWVYYKMGRNDLALTYLMKALSVLDDPEILGHISAVYRAEGEHDKADEYWQRSLKTSGIMDQAPVGMGGADLSGAGIVGSGL